jgi:hypothetical protein
LALTKSIGPDTYQTCPGFFVLKEEVNVKIWRVVGKNEVRFYELGTHKKETADEAKAQAGQDYKHLVKLLALRLEAILIGEEQNDDHGKNK